MFFVNNYIFFLLFTYFICAIPFGYFLVKIFCGKDVREYGSKNIGATNVTRVAGKKIGFLTLILDSFKGLVMVLLAKYIFKNHAERDFIIYLTAFIAVFAHIFPIYLKFEGGKGVSTTLGVFFGLDIFTASLMSFIWLCIFLLTRISSISSLISVLSSVIFVYLFDYSLEKLILVSLIFLIVVIRHKENIKLLIKGKENAVIKSDSKKI